MRVTRETRERTRRAILAAAEERFAATGFGAATTREIALAAGIAAGTLFNYFPSKETLGMALLVSAGEVAEAEFDATRREGESLEETMFALVAIQLRHFGPYRAWVGEVLDAVWSPLATGGGESEAAGFRIRHLDRVQALLQHAGMVGLEECVLDQHLYWTLYVGTLSFWARDTSEHQEATLAFLDRSTGLFCRSLRERAPLKTGGE